MRYFFGLPLGSIRCAWLRMYSSTATAIKLLKGTFAPPVKPCNATRMRESFWSVSGLNRTLMGRPTFSESAFAIGEIVAISGIGGNTVATVAYMYYNDDMYDTTRQLENGGKFSPNGRSHGEWFRLSPADVRKFKRITPERLPALTPAEPQ